MADSETKGFESQRGITAFYERHFREMSLFVLFLFLLCAHTAMVHWNRPVEMVHWAENFISAVLAALIALLGPGPKEKEPEKKP